MSLSQHKHWTMFEPHTYRIIKTRNDNESLLCVPPNKYTAYLKESDQRFPGGPLSRSVHSDLH